MSNCRSIRGEDSPGCQGNSMWNRAEPSGQHVLPLGNSVLFGKGISCMNVFCFSLFLGPKWAEEVPDPSEEHKRSH